MEIKRVFIPGSEWLYLKIYSSTSLSDNLIAKDLLFIVNKLFQKKLIDKWFFIRYKDPEPHIRIRFLLKDELLFGKVLNIIYKRIKKDVGYLIWKVQLDTYKRELERYNKDLIEENETLFYYNSCCIALLLKEMSKNNFDEKYRWFTALKLIDCILDSFEQNIDSKLRILERMSISFKKEFNFSSKNISQFKSKYRNNRNLISQILDNSFNEVGFDKIYSIINFNSKRYKIITNRIMNKILIKKNSVNLDVLIGDHIHMMMNRLFYSDNRIYELIIYDFMHMYYKGIYSRD